MSATTGGEPAADCRRYVYAAGWIGGKWHIVPSNPCDRYDRPYSAAICGQPSKKDALSTPWVEHRRVRLPNYWNATCMRCQHKRTMLRLQEDADGALWGPGEVRR